MALLLSKPPKKDLDKPTQDIADRIETGPFVKAYLDAQAKIEAILDTLKRPRLK